MHIPHKKHAFSLVELSIVLVILGLLVGGILVGQSLIRASELRSISADFNRYHTAVYAFRDKYMGFPGDMRDATRLWGRQTSDTECPTNSGTAINASGGACDGNGSGNLIYAYIAAAGKPNENMQVWRHLALAGMIEGNFTGVAGPNHQGDSTLGVNVPAARLANTGWYMSNTSTLVSGTYYPYIGDTETIAYNYGNYFTYGASRANRPPNNPALKPEEAWNIDTKLDDGLPARGKIIGRYWNDLCSTPNVVGTASQTNLDTRYKVEDPTPQCALQFVQIY